MMSRSPLMGTAPAPKRCDVAVCGGGLGGLALAAGLLRRGFDVHVFEAAPELRTATSTLVGLGGNGFKALDDLHPDITPKLKERGALTQSTLVLARPSKEEQPTVVRVAPVTETVTIRWSEVQRTLAELVTDNVVHCGYKTLGYTEDEEQGLVRVHFKGQPDVEARLVVGADGVRSAIRACMLPNDPGPRYLGHMNWNALLHNPGGNTTVEAHEPGEIQVHSDVLRGSGKLFFVSAYVIDAGADYTFWQVRIRFEEPSFTPPPAAAADGANGVEGGTTPQPQPSDPMVTDALPQLVGGGLGRPGSKARVEELLEGAGLDHVLRVVQATSESAIFERVMIDRIPLDELGATMHSKSGRVLLLGDAAHAMHSGPGQGARTAFEDACVLATLLDQHRDELVGWRPADSLSSNSTFGQLGADKEGVAEVASQYNEARLVRTCRIQRYAAEGCGLPSLVERLRPANLTKEDVKERSRQFFEWLNQFPANASGDPCLEHWQPPKPAVNGAC